MSTLKAIKSHVERSYDKQNITLVVILYEIYQTSLRRLGLLNKIMPTEESRKYAESVHVSQDFLKVCRKVISTVI